MSALPRTHGMQVNGADDQPVGTTTAGGKTGLNVSVIGTLAVTSTPVYSNTIGSGGSGLITVTTDALLLAQNLSRVGYKVQNVSTTVIYVLEGTGVCSATNFTYSLPACGVALDGSSPIYRDTQWQGPVRFCAASGTGKVSYAEYA